MKFSYSAGDRPLEGLTIKRAIHRGGFGEVYYAVSDAGKDVAIKLLHDNMEVELRGVSQCLNLSHPNLVTIFDVKTDADGDHWIVMEYVAGKTLAQIISEHPQGMPVARVRELLHQCCAGLGFLHNRGLVHRDLKPANIFSEEGQIKIGDVGLSKFISASQRSAHTQSVGTVYYMAPEVARGRYGPGVDIYAMGVIAYEMLTGKIPFDGESTGEILMKHLTADPDLKPIPPALQPVIGKALAKEESARYQSISEFENAFAAAVSGETVTAEQPHAANPKTVDGTRKKSCGPFGPCGSGAKSDRTSTLAADNRADWVLRGMIGLGLVLMLRFVPPRHVLGVGVLVGLIFVGRWFLMKCYAMLTEDALGRPRSGIPKVPPASPLPRQKAVNRSAPPSLGERTSALFLGAAAAPLYIGAMAAAVAFFSQSFFASYWSPGSLDPGHIAFFVASSSLATWVLLVFMQLRPRPTQDASALRLSLGVVGFATGLAISGMGQFFMVDFPRAIFNHGRTGIVSSLGQRELAEHYTPGRDMLALPEMIDRNDDLGPVYTENGTMLVNQPYAETESTHAHPADFTSSESAMAAPARDDRHSSQVWRPTMLGYGVFFALLFSLRSWWRVTSERRDHWFEIGSILWTAGMAWAICTVFTFPVIWGMTWAATITAALQLSTWVKRPERRHNLAR
ncbi:serine/threonine protein kinase [Rubinisphaera margarita]|uniref:serine/threonine protein kinase n=1 Tax=Rubinisphaera margarita TaxID=2909586 RepID=UPI001EE7F810|nr:serine/threonine-protein kinase [Rubinisphaera margarita]MCG6157820.1 serine/threonine protein kinase [Rubinisphaera margarita]